MKYEKPQLISLDVNSLTFGANCYTTGASATNGCDTGTNGSTYCHNGNSNSVYCQNGNSNTSGQCYSGSSQTG